MVVESSGEETDIGVIRVLVPDEDNGCTANKVRRVRRVRRENARVNEERVPVFFEDDGREGLFVEDYHCGTSSEAVYALRTVDASRRVIAALTSPANRGCAFVGRERSSGCACVPM